MAQEIQLEELDRLRRTSPFDPVTAQLWCAAALQLGQAQKARRYATMLYSAERNLLRRAQWAQLAGQAAFSQLKFDESLVLLTLSIGHLCEIADQGRLPLPIPHAADNASFVDGLAEHTLRTTCAGLAGANIPAFPFAGTLLGLTREGKLLPFDKDIDLGVWMENFRDCCNWLSTNGWRRNIGGMPPYTDFASFNHPESKLVLDIVALTRNRRANLIEGGYHLLNQPPQYQSTRRYGWFEIEARTDSLGTIWQIKEPEQVLKALYGNWQQPNPLWDGMVSSNAMTEFSTLVRCYAYNRLCSRWLSGQFDRASAYAHQILTKDPEDLVSLRAKHCLSEALRVPQKSPKPDPALDSEDDHDTHLHPYGG